MADNSVTGLLNVGIQDLLKKASYDENIFWLLDLSAAKSPISGNKAWKLLPQIEFFLQSEYEQLLTFGGAYSNHIYQTAKLSSEMGISAVGLIRSDAIDHSSPTLKAAMNWGMRLVPISRTDYRNRNLPSFKAKVQKEFPKAWIIPEGGTNSLGVVGTYRLGQHILKLADDIMIKKVSVPVGTGGTIAGIINGIEDKINVKGYAALKGDFLIRDISRWLTGTCTNWSCEDDVFFGGYAKWNMDLIHFIKRFFDQTGIVTDPIYVGKMLFKAHNSRELNDKTLFIHTGGQQGNAGMNHRFELNLPTV